MMYSSENADYDAKAFDSVFFPQRYWQRQRYKLTKKLLIGQTNCIDVGCGSSRIIELLPPGSVAVDILFKKVQYSKIYGHQVLQGDIQRLPFDDESFSCLLCSEVIEHLPNKEVINELDRILKPGGTLILSTPDYSKWQWRIIEKLYKIILPNSYGHEHITHYTYKELVYLFNKLKGYKIISTKYICQADLILSLQKPC